MQATSKQHEWSSGKFQDKAAPLSGFERITQDTPQDQWLSTPAVVDYVRANFETRYCPEFMIAALSLRFSDPELNKGTSKHTKLVPETTIISIGDMSESDHTFASYELDVPK